jgi:hypothetical protein
VPLPPKPDLTVPFEEEPGDVSLVRIGDYDGDGRADLGLIRPLDAKAAVGAQPGRPDPDVSTPVRLDLYLSGARDERPGANIRAASSRFRQGEPPSPRALTIAVAAAAILVFVSAGPAGRPAPRTRRSRAPRRRARPRRPTPPRAPGRRSRSPSTAPAARGACR